MSKELVAQRSLSQLVEDVAHEAQLAGGHP